MTQYRVYDVFTDQPFGGNQLAVIPDATGLPEPQLQHIAREFNFSETTFVYPPTDNAHTAKVRIFTPTMEVPFAGHPTIGTAVALADLGYGGAQILELGVGPIRAQVDGNSASFVTDVPLSILANPDVDLVARALGIASDKIVVTTHAPVQAGLGLDFVFVELQNSQALAAIRTSTETFTEGKRKFPAGLDFAIFAYCRENTAIRARMFAPLDNIPEDPATGSASAALAALLRQKLLLTQTLDIQQGIEMGRPSIIKATADLSGNVTIAGQAVLTMQGTLML
ncbi:PhzF family phenazine biosynthesis protein [Aestuariibius sp. HNIBRBA575]|uniref:PhzF family phenazine biosynthesis protein n=1 Tax=Aestuariibius sp. HNIBRBA575 TaxID=3233343 RepID=UPI0034A3DDE0